MVVIIYRGGMDMDVLYAVHVHVHDNCICHASRTLLFNRGICEFTSALCFSNVKDPNKILIVPTTPKAQSNPVFCYDYPTYALRT
jgi:hypothetical protein